MQKINLRDSMCDKTHIFNTIGRQLFKEFHENTKFYRDDKLERKIINTNLKRNLTYTMHNTQWCS